MNQIKLTLLLFSLLFCTNALAAQIATITSPKAIIYADMKMSTPLGYISYGKKVKVGEVERKDGTVLPIALSGRIAYIKVKDISIKRGSQDAGVSTPKITEHDVEMTFKTDQDKLSENNFISLSMASFSGGQQWQEYSEEFNDESSNFFNVNINMEHRNPGRRMSWGFGVGYYTVSQEQLEAKTLTLDATLYYALLHFRYLTLEAFGGVNFSGDFKISQGNGEQITKGVLYGYNFGGVARILPYSKIGFFAGASLKSLYIRDLDTIESSSGQEITLKGLSGYNAFAGVSYKF